MGGERRKLVWPSSTTSTETVSSGMTWHATTRSQSSVRTNLATSGLCWENKTTTSTAMALSQVSALSRPEISNLGIVSELFLKKFQNIQDNQTWALFLETQWH